MRTFFLLVSLLSNISLLAQSIDYDKLAKACELWGLIKYFHPESPGISFDSAFAAAVPQMLASTNEKQWKQVTSHWLNSLHDENTRVVSDAGYITPGKLNAEFDHDSVLVITISGTSDFMDYVRMTEFFNDVSQKLQLSRRGLIFDLRHDAGVPRALWGYFGYYFSSLNAFLAAEPIPQFVRKYYSGFMPEDGTSSGGYQVNEISQNPIVPGTFSKRNQMVVWIVNQHSELPVVALSQQAAGKGIILGDTKSITKALPLSSSFSLSDSLSVMFRISDVRMSNGFQPGIDVLYAPGEDPVALAKTLFTPMLRQGARERVVSPLIAQVGYPADKFPSIGYRVLAAAKIFTIIQTFFPYSDLMEKDWREVLRESLPEFVEAKSEIDYGLAVAKMYAHIHDSHGYMQGNKALTELQGEAPSPLIVEWIEEEVVVTEFRNDSACVANQIQVGDVIEKVNGIEVKELMKKYEIYFAHSTKPPVLNAAAKAVVRGPEKESATYTIRDAKGKQREVTMQWTASNSHHYTPKYNQDTLTLLDGNIGYADLTRMIASQTDTMFEMFKNTKAIIFDMRGYPKGTAWTIAPRLSEKRGEALALFRKPEVLSFPFESAEIPASRSWTEFTQSVAPSDKWKYEGKTVMLINHYAMSQAEHTGLFFEAMDNTTFIGTPTVGANGDVTRFSIPGGITLSFSGQGVWHADGRQLQRVGLQPHVLVAQTIEGIREGKDEVLEAAIEYVNQK